MMKDLVVEVEPQKRSSKRTRQSPSKLQNAKDDFKQLADVASEERIDSDLIEAAKTYSVPLVNIKTNETVVVESPKKRKIAAPATPTVGQVKIAPSVNPAEYCGFCCALDKPSNLLTCKICANSGHRQCLQMNEKLFKCCKKNPNWLCIECKNCAICEIPGNDDLLLFCDKCDEGVHMYCLNPVVTSVPNGSFLCPKCITNEMPVNTRAVSSLSNLARKVRALIRSQESGEDPPAYALDLLKSPKKTTTKARKDILDIIPCETPPRQRSSSSKSKRKSRSFPMPESPHKSPVVKVSRRKKGDPSASDEKMYLTARAIATQQLVSDRDLNAADQRCIEVGEYNINTWYSAPYPEEYAILPKLFLCEFCLKYMKSLDNLRRHQDKCEMSGHPPGKEIYRNGVIQVWEVDGKLAKIYCQNLCLLAKLFLDHKTLYYDVEPFWFYVLTTRDQHGSHFVGYFSKEKDSLLNYNVSCILTMPHKQRMGYGKLLIDFSYLLSRKEGRYGSPEKPLSALGKISYESYWKNKILSILRDHRDETGLSIDDIALRTGLTHVDITNTLKTEKLLKVVNGRHVLVLDNDVIDAHIAKRQLSRKRYPDYLQLDESKLQWIPPSKRTSWTL